MPPEARPPKPRHQHLTGRNWGTDLRPIGMERGAVAYLRAVQRITNGRIVGSDLSEIISFEIHKERIDSC